MGRRTKKVHVLVQPHESEGGEWVYGEVLGKSDYAAAGPTRESVLHQLARLVDDGLEHGDVQLDDGLRPPVLRHLRLEVPVAMGDVLETLTVGIYAVCQARRGDDDDRTVGAARGGDARGAGAGYEIYLPQVSLYFSLKSLEHLEAFTLEQLRSSFELEHRAAALARFVESRGTGRTEGAESGGPKFEICELEVRQGADRAARPDVDHGASVLAEVGEPLHRTLDRRDAPRAFERRAEVETLINYLAGATERSVLLTGPSGVGKSAIVHEAVARIIADDVPEALHGVPVWQISGGRLVAGMRFLGQWQERVLAIIDEVRTHGAILFAENLLELLETSGTDGHAGGIPGMLLPHIQSGEVVLVTEARPEQLHLAERRHPAFMQALRRLPVDALSVAQTDRVLERVSLRLGRQSGARLGVETRQKILELVGRFRATESLPGPAVELAERMARTHAPQAVSASGQPRRILLPEHAVEAYASLTGLPAELLDATSAFDIDRVRRHFEDAIVGQPEAVEAMVDLVTVLRAGLQPPRRPLGSLLFLGPTGVGKTQTALTLARYLFGSSDRVIRFDMSEYQDSWSAARLVGRYKGEAGELVKRVREQPFQVLLFDEIEKADASVFDFLLQIMGEGRLGDALGQTVSLTSAVVIMTSNLGAGGPAGLGFEGQGDAPGVQRAAALHRHYRAAVEEFFRPEFIGRVDRVIAFRSLGEETARSLVERALTEAFSREGLIRRQIRVRTEPEVVDHLIRTGFDPRYGARPLRQAVEAAIVAPLASFLSRESDLRDVDLLFRMKDGTPELDLA